jgi:hypothetical protein
MAAKNHSARIMLQSILQYTPLLKNVHNTPLDQCLPTRVPREIVVLESKNFTILKYRKTFRIL